MQGRGISNSVASPGVSVLFGGMPSYSNVSSYNNTVNTPSKIPQSSSSQHKISAHYDKPKPKEISTEKPTKMQPAQEENSLSAQIPIQTKPKTQDPTQSKPAPSKPTTTQPTSIQETAKKFQKLHKKPAQGYIHPIHEQVLENKPNPSIKNLHKAIESNGFSEMPTLTQARMLYRK